MLFTTKGGFPQRLISITFAPPTFHMKQFFFVLSVAACVFQLSCDTSKKTITQYKTMDSIVVSATNNPMDIYRASRPLYWDITHTRVALTFNLPARTAMGKEWLRLRPYFYATDSVVLDARSMQIDSVMMVQGVTLVPLRFTYQNDELKIKLDKVYTRDESVTLYIKYKAMPYAAPTGGSAAITDDRGLYFINTNHEVPGKPVQIWTQGETESNSHWMPTIDQPNQRTAVQLELTVPDTFKTLANGELLRREFEGNHLRTDVWAMQQQIQVYAIMFAIGNFSIVEDKPANGIPVNYYVEPAFAPYAKQMFQHTPEMIGYFSDITGVPYPWNKYSQIVARDYVSGAMENTTASLFGEFMNQNAREIADKNYEDIVSHELFHQWFGDYVTAESWSNITVNESFANYSEQLWRGYKYGKASRDELAYNDLSKYLNQTQYNDEQLVRFHYGDKEEVFDRISYEKGGAILNYLNGLTGDEAFHKAMNIYLTKNALQPAEAHNWRMAIEEATGLDWNWFFNQWYYRGGHPVLDIQYNYDDDKNQLTVNVRQTASDSGKAYKLPMKAALIYGSDKEIIDWTVDGKKQSFTFPYHNGVKPVFVPDQEHWLPGDIHDHKKPWQWLTQLQQSGDYINKRKAIAGAYNSLSDSLTQKTFHAALSDSLYQVRSYALTWLQKTPDKYGWHKNFKNEVVFLALNDGSNEVRARAFDVLGIWKAEGSKQEMIEALTDSSYMVAGAALGALQKISKDAAYVLAKAILKTDPKANLESTVWNIIALKGDSSDIALFEAAAPYVYGTRKISFAADIYLYNINTQSIAAFENGLQILTRLAAQESIKTYRYAIGSMVFGTVSYNKEQAKATNSAEKAALLNRKLQLAEQYRDQILKAEQDPDNLKKYRQLL
jgi:aminopeptidase N